MQYETDGELQTDASEAENEQGCHAEHVSGNAKLVVYSESEHGSGTESEPCDDAAAVSASALQYGDAAMTHVIDLLAELPATVDLECDVGAIFGEADLGCAVAESHQRHVAAPRPSPLAPGSRQVPEFAVNGEMVRIQHHATRKAWQGQYPGASPHE